MKITGRFIFEAYSPDGDFLRRVVIDNAVTTAGLNYVLGAALGGVTPITAWRVGLIGNTPVPSLSPGDTMASHSGWTEFTGYSESTRGLWTPAAASGGLILNSSFVVFTLTSALTLAGAFLTSDSTKGGTSGTLFSHALTDGGNQVFGIGEIIRGLYEVELHTG